MSPQFRAAVEFRLDEMRSSESAEAAVAAGRAIRLARKHNVHDPYDDVRRYAIKLLCGVRLHEIVDRGDA